MHNIVEEPNVVTRIVKPLSAKQKHIKDLKFIIKSHQIRDDERFFQDDCRKLFKISKQLEDFGDKKSALKGYLSLLSQAPKYHSHELYERLYDLEQKPKLEELFQQYYEEIYGESVEVNIGQFMLDIFYNMNSERALLTGNGNRWLDSEFLYSLIKILRKYPDYSKDFNYVIDFYHDILNNAITLNDNRINKLAIDIFTTDLIIPTLNEYNAKTFLDNCCFKCAIEDVIPLLNTILQIDPNEAEWVNNIKKDISAKVISALVFFYTTDSLEVNSTQENRSVFLKNLANLVFGLFPVNQNTLDIQNLTNEELSAVLLEKIKQPIVKQFINKLGDYNYTNFFDGSVPLRVALISCISKVSQEAANDINQKIDQREKVLNISQTNDINQKIDQREKVLNISQTIEHGVTDNNAPLRTIYGNPYVWSDVLDMLRATPSQVQSSLKSFTTNSRLGLVSNDKQSSGDTFGMQTKEVYSEISMSK